MDDRAALLERIHELEAALSHRDGELARLRQNVEALQRLLWGGSERRPGPDPAVAANQLFLAGILEGALRGPAVEHAEVTTTIQVPAHVRTKKGRRAQFPEHLPVLTTRIELDASERTCRCGGDLVPMGQETSKELERVEFSLVHEIQRVTYCCRSCQENMVTAPAPDRVIDKGLLGVGFLAHVLTERFQHHMPYHRQEKKYASEGLALSRSVLCSSAIRCAKLLQPIAEELKREILASGIVHTDDTPVTMLEDATGAKRQARVWIYRDIQGRCYFDCTESRSRDGPRAIFGDYAGYIVADAYPGYDRFFTEGTALEVACWAHTRRKFLAAESSEPELAREAIARIAELYAIEKAAADFEDEARRALRSEQARPRLAALRAWFAETRPTVLDRGPLAGAIDYALANWDALVRYTEDGRLPIDNNAAERALRCVAVGRKNWMFVGNPEGGRAAAGVYSLVETCKAAGVNPRDYFQDVLLRIGRCSDVTRLTPHGWKQHFQAEVETRRHDALRRLFGTA
ncbi:MAG: IS66 family transposase [Planctomycetes bacterium]|nr:IS66 family transposase [Planctomycetota bacterium]